MTQRLSQQATFLCRTDEFLRYVERKKRLVFGCCSEQTAADWLRQQCGVSSRGQLDRDPECAAAFERVLSEYRRDLAGESAPTQTPHLETTP